MARSTPSHSRPLARSILDPNPRDPGSGTHHSPVLPLAGPQPRDDGAHRPYSQPPGRPSPRPHQPRDPPQKGKHIVSQPRDAGM